MRYFQMHFFNQNACILIWNWVVKFQLTSQHWFKYRLETKKARRHYLNQCWLRWVLPYGGTRLQWINGAEPSHYLRQLSCRIVYFVEFKKNDIKFFTSVLADSRWLDKYMFVYFTDTLDWLCYVLCTHWVSVLKSATFDILFKWCIFYIKVSRDIFNGSW